MKYECITVHAIDRRGCQMNDPWPEGEETMGAAKKEARRLMRDEELRAAGLDKVEIRADGQCIYDYFVK